MLRLKVFDKYKKRLDSLNFRESGDYEVNELTKRRFFYDYPEYFYLYQNEAQILGDSIQNHYKYKSQQTFPDRSSILNIK